jgi:hypothetical protein
VTTTSMTTVAGARGAGGFAIGLRWIGASAIGFGVGFGAFLLV